jgi:hypothetical protein
MKEFLKIIPIVLLGAGTSYAFGESVTLYCKAENIVFMPIGGDEDMFIDSCVKFKVVYENRYDCEGFNLIFDTQGEYILKEQGSKYVLPLVQKSSFEYHFKLDEKTDHSTTMKELKLDRRDLSFNYQDQFLMSFGDAGNAGIFLSTDGACEKLDVAPVETLI